MKRAPFSWRRARQAFVVVLVAGAAFLADLSVPSSSSAQLLLAQASREQAVSVRGNRRIEAETILSYMDLRQGQTVTAEDLNRAVRRLFDTGLFRDVQIVPAEDQLIVEVIENPSINEIAFEGNDALADEDLERIISLRPRLPFTVSSAEADAQAIIEIYRRTGRFGAEVEPVIIERSDNRVDLVFEIAEGELTGVSSIDFVGNTVYSDRRLRGVVETSETGILSQFFSSDVYDPDRLELDKELLRQYYFERGYADFTVLSATAELAPDRDGFFITFTVSEGEEYTFGTQDVVVQAKGLDPEDFIAAVPDLEGETYDSSEVEDITNELTDIAGQAGFAFVQVRPRVRKNTENRVIDLSYQVAEGPRVFIERIEIEGNTQTLDRVIRREIDLVEGDPFDARKIREARRNIRGLRYFSSVEVDTEPGATEDRATLKVKVREQSTGSLSFGVGFSTSAGPIGNVALSERNFLGRGQQLNLAVTAAGDTQVYDFSFVEPAFLDRDLSVGFRAFLIDDDRSDESSIEIARLGAGPTVGFPLGEKTDLSLRYEFVREDVEVDDTASAVLQADDGERFTSSVGYTLTYDERNDALEPTGGYLLTASQDFAGLGGDARYVSSVASAKGWTSFFDEEVVASLELEAAGVVGFSDDIRFNERFFLGGSNLRGFADEGAGPRDLATDDSLGGNYRLRASLQASFPLGLPDELGIFGGAFVDAGTLFDLDNTNGTNNVQIDDSANIRVSAGGLLFISTPFGPLELSFGFPLIDEDEDDSELFRLSVGTRF
ncbi:MAG: outer membrane protein assembly factor BamA [Pseudomonadota bacterium]